MNKLTPEPVFGSGTPIGELLLAETAIRIELPPGQHKIAVERYESVRTHIERPDSPLHDRVTWFYPQGSMAIGATIKSRKRSDGYDIDIVAELDVPPDLDPGEILDLLFEATNGPTGSRYHGMVERQTRCVTVYYADGMHLDITPSVLLDAADPRRSHIFHAKPEEPKHRHRLVVMNSWGFCDWFNAVTPHNKLFEQAYARRVYDHEHLEVLAEADVKPVPDHASLEGGKSTTVVALQLLKRNRNMKYERRRDLRLPPSVMMASVAGETQVPDSSISGALDAIASAMLSKLEQAKAHGQLVDIRNPRCQQDKFTDRWPETLAAQDLYIQDLKEFRLKLAALISVEFGLEGKRKLLAEMFGESPADAAVAEYAKTITRPIRSGVRTNQSSSGLLAGGLSAASAASIAAPKHTFYGEKARK